MFSFLIAPPSRVPTTLKSVDRGGECGSALCVATPSPPPVPGSRVMALDVISFRSDVRPEILRSLSVQALPGGSLDHFGLEIPLSLPLLSYLLPRVPCGNELPTSGGGGGDMNSGPHRSCPSSQCASSRCGVLSWSGVPSSRHAESHSHPRKDGHDDDDPHSPRFFFVAWGGQFDMAPRRAEKTPSRQVGGGPDLWYLSPLVFGFGRPRDTRNVSQGSTDRATPGGVLKPRPPVLKTETFSGSRTKTFSSSKEVLRIEDRNVSRLGDKDVFTA